MLTTGSMSKTFKPMLFILALALCSGHPSATVYGQMMDSIRKSFKETPQFALRMDSRRSFITRTPAKIFGFKAGLDHRDQVQYGLGFNTLATDFTKVVNGDTGTLDFSFIAPYFEYTFYNKYPWELAIPVQVGIGRSRVRLKKENGEQYTRGSGAILTYEPALSVEYKFWDYLGIGGAFGYRLMVIPNQKIDEELTAPVYLFQLKVYFGKIYRDVFKGGNKKDGETE